MRPQRPLCREDSPLMCPERKAAMDALDFRYLEHIGWIWHRAKSPGRPWRRCPWCWGVLPTMVGIVTRGVTDGFEALHTDGGLDDGTDDHRTRGTSDGD